MADVLGHADPALTLRVSAHAMRGEEEDLSFAEYGSRRLSASPTETMEDRELAKSSERLARREGFEPPTLHERTRARTRTPRLGGVVWHAGRGSNPRPSGSKPGDHTDQLLHLNAPNGSGKGSANP